ncbi:hypothetical protein [Zobellia alginiliquefaciens]|uniref:hypothetical protein n=1 Tax=Zobellia alginiliquefaciens TaxID=3032586 RepID=UPI0023E40EC9|nr:hypothetical protein [Zobellia alginiliquefaciens]
MPQIIEAFYNYVYDDFPFEINGKIIFFVFYETSIPAKVLKLAPAIFNDTLNTALANEEDVNFVGGDDMTRTNN